jgi:drug/metabolite transporter superfamily protein YnfA
MRSTLTFVLIALPSLAMAHGVHAAVEDGHSHWVAPVGALCAAVIAAIVIKRFTRE